MEKIIEVLKSTAAKRFAWQTLGGALGLVIIVITDTNWIYAPLVIAFIQGITKEINTRYL
jgi:hypothetical protein